MTVGWGVVGCGRLAGVTIPDGIFAAPNAELVGVTDVVVERTRETADRFHTRAFPGIDELLSEPSIDAVYVATPHASHAELTIAAARRGKHVLCEKPLALNAEQAHEMVRACEEAGVTLGHGTMMRFNSCHQTMRELLVRGEIGRPVAVHARYGDWWAPEVPGASADDETIWRMDRDRGVAWRQSRRLSGGGAMMDMGVHVIDTAVFLLGHVKEVAAFCDTLTSSADVEDTASVLLKFQSGVQATLESYTSVSNVPGRRRFQVFGESGSLLAEETMGPPSARNRLFHLDGSVDRKTEPEPREVECPPVNMYETQFRLFSEAVETGSKYVNPGEEGLHVQRVLDAVYRSSGERRFISIGVEE